MARFTYSVESIGLANVSRARELPALIQRVLNEKDAEGWEFIESHPDLDDPSTRVFVFRRESSEGDGERPAVPRSTGSTGPATTGDAPPGVHYRTHSLRRI
jgi:hypothetical protein